MGSVQVKNLISEMKLGGISEVLEKTLQDATQNSWGYSEFLDVLLQAENDHRQKKKAEGRIKASKLRRQASFEDFDYTAKRNITKAQVREIQSLQWCAQGRPLIIIGQTGVGKTFLAQAAGLHACLSGKSVMFMSVSTLLENQVLARSTSTYLKLRDKLTKPDLLILDDFGMRKFNSMEAEDLREIIEERSYGKSTVITTQLPLDHWSEVLPDPVIADAIIDRLDGLALQIKITGESYRKVKAKKLDSMKEAK
jgi:DNA replication protein DnaC